MEAKLTSLGGMVAAIEPRAAQPAQLHHQLRRDTRRASPARSRTPSSPSAPASLPTRSPNLEERRAEAARQQRAHPRARPPRRRHPRGDGPARPPPLRQARSRRPPRGPRRGHRPRARRAARQGDRVPRRHRLRPRARPRRHGRGRDGPRLRRRGRELPPGHAPEATPGRRRLPPRNHAAHDRLRRPGRDPPPRQRDRHLPPESKAASSSPSSPPGPRPGDGPRPLAQPQHRRARPPGDHARRERGRLLHRDGNRAARRVPVDQPVGRSRAPVDGRASKPPAKGR